MIWDEGKISFHRIFNGLRKTELLIRETAEINGMGNKLKNPGSTKDFVLILLKTNF